MPQIYDTPTYGEVRMLVATSIANLRAQTAPTAVGNALAGTDKVTYPICLVLGSAGAIGTNAAFYVWDATSALADNNSTVIKPTSPQVGGNPGRWVIIGSTL